MIGDERVKRGRDVEEGKGRKRMRKECEERRGYCGMR